MWSTYNGTVDLNTLIPLNSGWFLREARGINDQGMIVGNGTLNGVERGFLLAPSTGGSQVIIAQVTRILSGIIDDGPGVVWPGGPVPPWGPMTTIPQISVPTRDLLLTVLAGEVGLLVNDPTTQVRLREASLKAVAQLAQKELKNLKLSHGP